MVQAHSFADNPSLAARARPLWLVILLAVLLLMGRPPGALAQEAERGWTVCNQTSFITETAIGRPEGRSIVVEGWTKIKPGSCRTVLTGPLQLGVHFLYARSSAAHRGGLREWSGDQPLCVDVTGSFAVESPPDCSAMGLVSTEFRPVMIERRTGWRTVLEESNEYTASRLAPNRTPLAAGVQRLLSDAGIFEGRIDGYIGRKTRRAIAEFLELKGLEADISDDDLIDILEQEAIARARNLGLTLCNRTNQRIWAAIARQKSDGWESRGWWQIEAGGCARAIDEELLLVPHFVYGEMEVPEGVRKPLRGSDAFCVARSLFAIKGRTDCEASAYRSELFIATPVPEDGKLVHEFFERDFGVIEPVR